ncbi:hypothetical protein cypCar_00002301 [Cyprinus carpio]|nr:hypothetical protein cypCar_00002301 [Cyprinus carpio]
MVKVACTMFDMPLRTDLSNKKSPVPEDATALFGPPLETAFDEQKTSEVCFSFFSYDIYDICVVPDADGHKEVETLQRPSITDLDNIFGPEDSSKPGEDVGDKWVCFNDESPKRPPLPSEGEPAPPLPSSPPPPAEPAPPLPKSPPPSEEPNPPLPKSPPPPAEMALSPPSIKSPKDSLPPVPKDTTPSPPTVPPPPVEEAPPTPKSDDLSLSKGDFSLCAPLTKTQSDPTNSPPTTIETSERTIPSPLVLNQEDKKSPEENPTKEDPSESRASPKEIGQGPRSTPPPPPPPTYRAVVSSPGPIPPAGSSSPARPSTPLDTSSSPPPPPPPRPPSRPKLPPGKPSVGDVEVMPLLSSNNCGQHALEKNKYFIMCVVKITGEMVLSFPAGITRHFANNSSPAVLTFSITNYSRLEHVLPNPQLLCCDTTQPNPNSKEFWVNMPNLMTHLKKVAEQKPQATYYNVDMLKYQVLQKGPQSTPLNLAVSWRCEPTSTDLRIDYKYNGGAMTTPVALNNVQFLIPVDGGVSKLQAVLPPAAWNAEQQKILWKIPDISQKSENGGVGSLLARFQLTEGPSKPAPVAVQFTSEGSTLSGCDIELVGLGYRFSLVKKRFAAGKYMADN